MLRASISAISGGNGFSADDFGALKVAGLRNPTATGRDLDETSIRSNVSNLALYGDDRQPGRCLSVPESTQVCRGSGRWHHASRVTSADRADDLRRSKRGVVLSAITSPVVKESRRTLVR